MILHWALALVLLALVFTVLASVLAPSPRPVMRGWHHGLGLAIWPVTAMLLAWRFYYGPRLAPEPSLFPWQRLTLRVVAILLYGLLLVLPPLGYLAASGQGDWVRVFGGSFLPSVVQSAGAASFVLGLHRLLAWTFLAVLVLHIGIALYHHTVLRDRLLRRILPE